MRRQTYLKTAVLALLLLMLHAAPAAAQTGSDTCRDDETPVECFQRLLTTSGIDRAVETKVAAEKEKATTQVPASMGKVVQASATPVNVEALAASSLTDFLSKFVAGAGIGSFDDKEDSWTFRFNPWSPYKPASKSDWLVTVTAQEPELLPPLGKALSDADLSSAKEELQNDLGELDDVDLALSWNRRTKTFGRDYRSHKDLISGIYSSLVEETYREVEPGFDSLIVRLGRFENGVEATTFAEMPAAQAAEVRRLVVEEATQEREVEQTLATKLQATGFHRLADLINNQPQIQASATYRSRGDTVGPDEVIGKLTAEIGLLNVRTFKHSCDGEADAACLADYTQEMGDAIATAPRFTLALEYADVDDFAFSLPDDDFEFKQDGGERIIGSLTYGMYLRPDAPLESRFELDAGYHDVDGDTMRQDRFVATATFIQKLADGTATSLSLVYANKPEYLGEVDEELSARVGLRYSMGGKKKE